MRGRDLNALIVVVAHILPHQPVEEPLYIFSMLLNLYINTTPAYKERTLLVPGVGWG